MSGVGDDYSRYASYKRVTTRDTADAGMARAHDFAEIRASERVRRHFT